VARKADGSGPTRDAFLGGRVVLSQPARGFRAGLDAVMLAAAIPACAGDRVLDLGCGVGAVALCLHARVAGLSLTGVEVQPDYAALARTNGVEAGAEFEVVEASVEALPAALRAQRFSHVFLNPPFYPRGAGSPAANSGRESALRETAPLSAWITIAARRVAPRGTLTVLVGADRLPEALAAIPRGFGGVTVKPLAPLAGADAIRVILRAVPGSRAAFRLLAPLVLHKAPGTGAFTPEAEAILRGAAALDDLATRAAGQ